MVGTLEPWSVVLLLRRGPWRWSGYKTRDETSMSYGGMVYTHQVEHNHHQSSACLQDAVELQAGLRSIPR